MAASLWGWIKRYALAIQVLGPLLILDFLLAFSSSYISSKQQQVAKCAEEGYGVTQSLTYRSFSRFEDWVGRHEHFIIAASTVAIAIFTLTLWRSTDRLWVAGQNQLLHLKRSSKR